MFCAKCGKELRDGDLFCSSCGTKIEHNASNISDAQQVNQSSVYNIEEVDTSQEEVTKTQSVNQKQKTNIPYKKLMVSMGVAVVISFSILAISAFMWLKQSHMYSNKSKDTVAEASEYQNIKDKIPQTDNSKPELTTDETLVEEYGQLTVPTILSIINKAYNAKYNVMMGGMYNMTPADDDYYPMSSEFNTYDKMEAYLSNFWETGYALVFLNEFSYCIRTSDKGYYMLCGDIGWTPDYLSSILWESEVVDGKIKQDIMYKGTDNEDIIETVWLVKEEGKWKLTTPEVGKITRSDIKLEEVTFGHASSQPSENSSVSMLSVDEAYEIALRSYPDFDISPDGSLGIDAYDNQAYIFSAYDHITGNYYGVCVLLDGSCYAHIAAED